MLALRQASRSSTQCRGLASAASLQQIRALPSEDVEQFRLEAFKPEQPVILPGFARGKLPALRKWFHHTADGSAELNRTHLSRFGAMQVPLEFSDGVTFSRSHHSFHFFLECDHANRAMPHRRKTQFFSASRPDVKTVRKVNKANTFFTPTSVASPPKINVYLAQAPIVELPRDLQHDLPVPVLVKEAGNGDVYDSSIWLGRVPTYTPLHKDPNPNLFVQLAGTKIVRMFRPEVGRAIFAKVQEQVGGSASETLRGEEMMQGKERLLLEHEVWAEGSEYKDLGLEAKLSAGDALFIPKGYWHSVRGTGKGINGSVNWWFR